MPRRKRYLLTPTAARQLREAKAWSLARWGADLTREYFKALDDAANNLAKNHRLHRSRDELSGGTGLSLFPVREHYLVYEILPGDQIVVIAVLLQERDIARILSKGKHVILRELNALRKDVENRD